MDLNDVLSADIKALIFNILSLSMFEYFLGAGEYAVALIALIVFNATLGLVYSTLKSPVHRSVTRRYLASCAADIAVAAAICFLHPAFLLVKIIPMLFMANYYYDLCAQRPQCTE